MKTFHLIFISLVLLACEPYHKEKTEEFSLPDDMKLCKIHYISDGNISLYVAKCPHFDTTTVKPGKHSTHTSLINEDAEDVVLAAEDPEPIDRDANQLKQRVRVLKEQLDALEKQLQEQK